MALLTAKINARTRATRENVQVGPYPRSTITRRNTTRRTKVVSRFSLFSKLSNPNGSVIFCFACLLLLVALELISVL